MATLREQFDLLHMNKEEQEYALGMMKKILPDDFPEEKCAQKEHYRFLWKYIKQLRTKDDKNPEMLKPLTKYGFMQRCGKYCGIVFEEMAKEGKRAKLIRGYKIFVALHEKEIVGMKAVAHFVLEDENGVLRDVTYEPDDRENQDGDFKYLYVPSKMVHSELSDQEIMNGAETKDTRVFGNKSYVSMVEFVDSLKS